jgi:hypothetical protein
MNLRIKPKELKDIENILWEPKSLLTTDFRFPKITSNEKLP